MPARAARRPRLVSLIAFLVMLAGTALVTDAQAARRSHIHVWVKSPRPGHTVSGVVPCHVVVHARRGVRKVRFSLDGEHLNTRTVRPFDCRNTDNGRIDTHRLSEGKHQLSLRAWSRSGRSRLVRFNFSVRNNAPSGEPAAASEGHNGSGNGGGDLYFDGTHLDNFGFQEAAPNRIQTVSDPLGSGQSVFKFHVPNGDVYPLTPTESPRAQALSPNFIHRGMEFWIKDSIMLPSSFPTNLTWCDFLEIFGDPYYGSAPVSLQIFGDKVVLARNHTYHDDVPWEMPLSKRRWMTFILHERFGPDGWVELWADGKPATFSNGEQRLYMQTQDRSNNESLNHAKIASYRLQDEAADVTLYHKDFRVGRTRASVGG